MQFLSLVVLVLATTILPARAEERLNVVASFSILGDFVKNVGGDRINVTILVGPNSDAHVYSPSPADAKKIADAKLVIVNGLGLEGWLPRLVQSAGSKATIITATEGIAPLKRGSDADPHAWQSVANAKIRSSADDAAPIVFSADRGVLLDLAEPVASGWIKVKHRDGQSGYVKASEVWGD